MFLLKIFLQSTRRSSKFRRDRSGTKASIRIIVAPCPNSFIFRSSKCTASATSSHRLSRLRAVLIHWAFVLFRIAFLNSQISIVFNYLASPTSNYNSLANNPRGHNERISSESPLAIIHQQFSKRLGTWHAFTSPARISQHPQTPISRHIL